MFNKSKSRVSLWYEISKNFDWIQILTIINSVFLAAIVILLFLVINFKISNEKDILSNILTINGIFSSILITFLITRISWVKERKFDTYKDAISLSQKILDYIRILRILTRYYNVWKNENATKNLLDNGRFKNIDFYEYKLYGSGCIKPKNEVLIKELINHNNHNGNETALYLAMVSLVNNRKSKYYEYQKELDNDFVLNGLYSLEIVEKWIECDIFGSIWCFLDEEYNAISYSILSTKDKEFINNAISRINKKHEGQILCDKLLKEITDDFVAHNLNELHLKLIELNTGVIGISKTIINIINVSLFFGVLLPFILLLFHDNTRTFAIFIGFVASLNSGLFFYFILRFRDLINRELKWI
ncbi:MAG: hypothetical protein EAZ53_14345 [Bacteroidetes bacterium]|nr:MAG: hypothetical protein EAZ53_14345 [Bacteroidota bacterium]